MCKLRAFDCCPVRCNSRLHSLLARAVRKLLCGISGGCFLVTAPDPWNEGTLRIDMISGQGFLLPVYCIFFRVVRQNRVTMSLYCNIMQSNAQDSLTRLAKKAMKVKNKAPAPIQITAEQLLREAKERDLEILPPPPKKKISDPEELKEYQFRRRKEYEDCIRKNRNSICNWIKYAKWEESQGEMQRSRTLKWKSAIGKSITHAMCGIVPSLFYHVLYSFG
ncbi:Crooked neck-like protein [Trichinella spiralis]|uniref:Crooked neck-like protein n=1 Tax=Trichinella spiralis TaxID=6334 RepID=A0ABR3KE35_TRISP